MGWAEKFVPARGEGPERTGLICKGCDERIGATHWRGCQEGEGEIRRHQTYEAKPEPAEATLFDG